MMDKPLELIIEALLFASSKPLTVQEIHRCLPDASAPDIKTALTALQSTYDVMDRSFFLKEVAGGYQIRTRPAYAPYVLRMLRSSPSRLSRAALETLAIIAYKQPVIRQEIEEFRGVDAGGILRTLLEKDLIRIVGRRPVPGRPLVYGTTKRFLEVFDLKDLESLPKLKELKEFGVGDEDAVHLPKEDGEGGTYPENGARPAPEAQGLLFPGDGEGPTP